MNANDGEAVRAGKEQEKVERTERQRKLQREVKTKLSNYRDKIEKIVTPACFPRTRGTITALS